MSGRVLVDGLGSEITPTSEADLISGLTEIHESARKRGERVIATLVADNDTEDPARLGIGLGGDDSVLVWYAGEWAGEGAISKGPQLDDTTQVAFRYGTAINHYLGWMLVPTHIAYEAAKEFFRTGERPTSAEWADV